MYEVRIILNNPDEHQLWGAFLNALMSQRAPNNAMNPTHTETGPAVVAPPVSVPDASGDATDPAVVGHIGPKVTQQQLEPKVTQAQLEAALLAFAQKHGAPPALKILSDFKVKRVTDEMTDTQRAELFASIGAKDVELTK